MNTILTTRCFSPARRAIFAPGMLVLVALLPGGCGSAGDSAAAGPDHGGGGNPAPAQAQRLTIVTTTAMVGDIVANVAGDRAAVNTLMGPTIDPHLYRPTQDAVRALLAADAIFYNGLNLEGKMSDTFVQVARSGKPVFAVTEKIDESFLLSPEEFAGHFDPHVWMDPKGWIEATRVVMSAMRDIDSGHAESHQKRGEAFIARLAALDAYARAAIATIPPARRILITAHDAFNYFGRAYGLEVRGIQGISTDSEAGLREIEALVDLLVARGIPAVFTETSVSDKNIQALIEGAGQRGQRVAIGGRLFSDAMGAPGTYEGTYLGMIDHNVTMIVRALGGEAPPRGMSGLLAAPMSEGRPAE
jgi:manganese/zinc/iron transport system substrate-binding protein